jgi:hypothetical protein
MNQIILHYFIKRTPLNEKIKYPTIFVGLNIILHGVLFNVLQPNTVFFLLYLLPTSLLVAFLGIIETTNNTICMKKKYRRIQNSPSYDQYSYDYINEDSTNCGIDEEKFLSLKKWFNFRYYTNLVGITLYVVSIFLFIFITLIILK